MSDPDPGGGDDTDGSPREGAGAPSGDDGPPTDSDGGLPPGDGPSSGDGPQPDAPPPAADGPQPGDGPPPTPEGAPGDRSATGGEPSPESPADWVRWFFRTDHGAVVYVREVLSSVGAVLLVGLILFAVSGLWPPMVAVESGSMEPHMTRGDLVFVMEEHRLAGDPAYADTGVVTYRSGKERGYRKFGLAGDVIVYTKNGNGQATPIIHRARFWVNESENWVANGKADPAHLGGADTCGEVTNCPAPHAGFVTKGDANSRYDQVSGLSEPVKPEWVVGTAEFRIPWLGKIRLWAGQTAGPSTGTVRGPVADHGGTAAAAAAQPAPTACAWS